MKQLYFKAKYISPTQEHWIIELDHSYLDNRELKQYLREQNLKGIDDVVGNNLIHRIFIAPEKFDQVFNKIKDIIKT